MKHCQHFHASLMKTLLETTQFLIYNVSHLWANHIMIIVLCKHSNYTRRGRGENVVPRHLTRAAARHTPLHTLGPASNGAKYRLTSTRPFDIRPPKSEAVRSRGAARTVGACFVWRVQGTSAVPSALACGRINQV